MGAHAAARSACCAPSGNRGRGARAGAARRSHTAHGARVSRLRFDPGRGVVAVEDERARIDFGDDSFLPGVSASVAIPAAAAPEPLTPPPKAAPSKAATAPPPTSLAAVKRELRARLRVVEAEIRARKALERERDQIRRLLAATNSRKTTAAVRQIRAAG